MRTGILMPSQAWDAQTERAQLTNQRGLGMLQGILGLQNAMQNQEYRAKEIELAEQERARIAQARGVLAGDPRISGNPALAALAQIRPDAVLPYLMPKPREDKPIGVSGGALIPSQNHPLGWEFMPTAPDRPPAETELGKLIRERSTLQQGDPRISLYDDKIKKLTTREPPIQINMPTFSGITQRINPTTGQPETVVVQAPRSGEPQVTPIGAPLPKAGGAAASITPEAAAQIVREEGEKLKTLISKNPAGAASILSPINRGVEAVGGLVSPQYVGPALEAQNSKQRLIFALDQLVKHGKSSNEFLRRIESMVGMSGVTTPGNATQAITDAITLGNSISGGGAAPAAKTPDVGRKKAEDFFR